MAFDCSNDEPLFSRVQKFLLRTNLSEERHRDLRISVGFLKVQSKVSKQVLNIQVSDDEDPFFYFSLVLTQEDYQHLKQLQGLLVDFESFPSQFIRLLEQCCENGQSNSKFVLLLEEENKNSISDGSCFSLKIVETNNFKQLSHLVLNLEPGNDNDIKKLMFNKLKVLKEQNEKAEKLIGELESQLTTKNRLLASKEEELVETQQKWKEDRLTFRAESSKELCEETEKLRKAQLEWQIKIQKERNDLEERCQVNLKEKESEIARLRLENQILQDKRSHADLTISDQARRMESLEKEVATFQGEIAFLRKQNSKLDSDYHEKEKAVNSLKTRLAVAEQEVKDMTILMNRQQDHLKAANEQKHRLEEVLGEKEKNLQRKLNTIQSLSDDLVKANSIISKIQKDLTVVSQKLKVRTVIALEQEKVVESNQQKIKELEEALSSKERQLKYLSESEINLKSSIAELNMLMEIKDKKIKDNERLIDWLNKRLADQSKAPVHNLGVPGVTSTPFTRFRNSDGHTNPPLPYSTITASAREPLHNILNGHDGAAESSATHPLNSQPTCSLENAIKTSNLVTEKVDSVPSSKGPKPSVASFPASKNSLTSKTAGKKTTARKVPGFRRTTLTQEVEVTTLPSSYFQK